MKRNEQYETQKGVEMRFKSAYDRAQKCVDKVNEKAQEIEVLLGSEDEADVQKALEMEADLDAAKDEAEKALALYDKLVGSDVFVGDAAKLFVPVSDEAAQQAGEANKVTREMWDAMTPEEQSAFSMMGGQVVKSLED